MRRNVLWALLLACLCGLATGCVSLLNREYRAPLQPHGEGTVENETGDFWEAQNYNELKQRLTTIVNQIQDFGVIRLYNYPGDPHNDFARACQEVTREDPFGAYAVNYFSPEWQPLVGYTEVRVSVSYLAGRKRQIPKLQSKADFTKLLQRELQQFSQGFVVEMSYYLTSDWDVPTFAQTVYLSEPAWAVGMPRVECKLYPETGFRHILDVTLSWPDSVEIMRKRVSEAQDALDSFLEKAPRTWSAPETALWLYDRLAQHIQFADPEDETAETTVANDLYGALVDGKTLGAGYALAYKRVCDEFGIPCEIVEGTRDGNAHLWNIIQLDEGYYHVDLAADDANDTNTFANFLIDDETMRDRARWTSAAVPRCDASDWSFAQAAELLALRGIELRDLTAVADPLPI